ncbi:hypothetical protein ANCDUO_14741 [Ancylostoma duodenale]|uniref:Nucleotide-diphospho-sugar transferase domain-containing protein n=1 Tax=Ancylostoma duodenale TaxID=51022 RepID=A0A0C2GDD4_9BILA|nr:hypothetical protein ANCDUO_14741 [Ancylostoma duodenale]
MQHNECVAAESTWVEVTEARSRFWKKVKEKIEEGLPQDFRIVNDYSQQGVKSRFSVYPRFMRGRHPRKVVQSMIAVAILLFLFLIRRLHGGHENWSYIHFSRPPEPIGEALNDLPPISFAELEHFLPDSVENKIAILDVIEADTATVFYQHAMMSVACYARAQGYEFRIVFSSNYSQQCPHKDVYLRRHCVVAHVLPQYHTILYIDADMGVVNPKRRIEEYIDEGTEIAFFDRFYNWEVAAGSYIVKNTQWTQKFLKGGDEPYYVPPLAKLREKRSSICKFEFTRASHSS